MSGDHMTAIPASTKPVRAWALWRLPLRTLSFVMLVFVLAASLSVITATRATISHVDLLRLGMLLGLGVGYGEISRQLERRRSLVAAGAPATVDMISVWTLAGAVILPPVLAIVVPVVTFSHLWWRSWRPTKSVHGYATAFNGAMAMLSVLVAGATVVTHTSIAHAGAAAVLGVLIAIAAYRATNLILVTAIIAVGNKSLRGLHVSLTENSLEFATLILGGVTAAALVFQPWFAVVVLPAVFMLQHRSLFNKLVEAATLDSKTELLNAGAWRNVAERDLARAHRMQGPASVLIIDMDHFKAVNDTHGHLAGDAALRAVGDVLSSELRGYDAVGRFGGEEFVALLNTDAINAGAVAERIRVRIAELRISVSDGGNESFAVTASIGIAELDDPAAKLDDVLRAADTAVYRAKESGRDRVCLAPPSVAVEHA